MRPGAFTRFASAAAVFIATVIGQPTIGQTQPLDFFHALIMRRAVIEREVELQIRHGEGRGLRETDALLAIDFPPLPCWQLELAVPLRFSEPSNGPSTAGVNDITLENKFLLWSSRSFGLAVTGGLDVRLPTGPTARGAGETAVTPFLSAGLKLGRFDLQLDLGYQWAFPAARELPREDRLTVGLAVGAPVASGVTPFLELTSIDVVRGGAESRDIRFGREQLYLVPGLNVDIAPGRTLLFGVELPATRARSVDYAIRLGIVWDF